MEGGGGKERCWKGCAVNGCCCNWICEMKKERGFTKGIEEGKKGGTYMRMRGRTNYVVDGPYVQNHPSSASGYRTDQRSVYKCWALTGVRLTCETK